MVTCSYHGFGGHEETVKAIHCRVVPELHGNRRLVLQLWHKWKNRHNQMMNKRKFYNMQHTFSQHLPVWRYKLSCLHTCWDVQRGQQTPPERPHGTLGEMAATKGCEQKVKRNRVSPNFYVYWSLMNAKALTAVESGSLAKLIPFSVRSVEAEAEWKWKTAWHIHLQIDAMYTVKYTFERQKLRPKDKLRV